MVILIEDGLVVDYGDNITVENNMYKLDRNDRGFIYFLMSFDFEETDKTLPDDYTPYKYKWENKNFVVNPSYSPPKPQITVEAKLEALSKTIESRDDLLQELILKVMK